MMSRVFSPPLFVSHNQKFMERQTDRQMADGPLWYTRPNQMEPSLPKSPVRVLM